MVEKKATTTADKVRRATYREAAEAALGLLMACDTGADKGLTFWQDAACSELARQIEKLSGVDHEKR